MQYLFYTKNMLLRVPYKIYGNCKLKYYGPIKNQLKSD